MARVVAALFVAMLVWLPAVHLLFPAHVDDVLDVERVHPMRGNWRRGSVIPTCSGRIASSFGR